MGGGNQENTVGSSWWLTIVLCNCWEIFNTLCTISQAWNLLLSAVKECFPEDFVGEKANRAFMRFDSELKQSFHSHIEKNGKKKTSRNCNQQQTPHIFTTLAPHSYTIARIHTSPLSTIQASTAQHSRKWPTIWWCSRWGKTDDLSDLGYIHAQVVQIYTPISNSHSLWLIHQSGLPWSRNLCLFVASCPVLPDRPAGRRRRRKDNFDHSVMSE